MTRDEFERIVRAMQDEGVPLSMANLLVRTELPRAQIETYLDEIQRSPKAARPKPKPADGETAEDAVAEGQSLVDRARSLRAEIVGDVVKSKLGVGDKPSGAKRDVKVGGVLGLALPPAGLAYAAPIPTAGVGTALYAALAYVAIHLPFIGIPYVLIPMHVIGGAAGVAYAWRFNRAGKRMKLLPGGR